MALLESTDIPLGTVLPSFQLRSVDGKTYFARDFSSAKAMVVMFICNHCPYVQAVEERIIELHRDYHGKGVQLVGICSNDPTDYPADSPANLLKRWQEKSYGFPYLIDESQEVAKAFGAVCTPDIYVYDAQQKLAYHGRIDDNWQHPDRVRRQELRAALDTLLAGKKPGAEQWPSMGCSIKWKK